MPSVRLFVLLGALITSAFSGPQVYVDVVLHSHSEPTSEPIVAPLAAAPESPAGKGALPPIRVTASLPGAVDLALYPGVDHVLRAEGATWSPPVRLRQGEVPARLTLAVTRTGDLEIPLVNGTGQPLDAWPESVAARFQLLEGPLEISRERSFETACPVETTQHGKATRHTMRCRLPEGVLDLRLEADGYIPDYRWGLRPEPGKVINGREYRLERGASVIGTVLQDDGSPAKGADVVVAPTVADSVAQASLRVSGRSLEYRTTTNDNGFFQVRGLPRGSFDLRASLQDYGLGSLPRLVVSAPIEHRLEEPLVIPYFPAGVVAIDPAVTLKGDPWLVRLFQPGGDAKSAPTDSEGVATFDLLPSGDYIVMVENDDGERLASKQVTLSPDAPRADIRIDQVPVIGTVTLDDEPLAATLYFGGRHGVQSVAIDSGEDGEFTGLLPHEGSWYLEVRAEDPKVRYAERDVQVEVDRGLGAAELAIELPGTSIEGKVVDTQGKPASGAQVIVQPTSGDAGIVQVATEDDGAFRLAGQQPGTYHVKALGRGHTSSATEVVEVSEDQPVEPLRLVLDNQREIRGHVVSPDGRDLPGVSVWAVLEQGSTAPTDALIPTATTGPDGRFTLHIAPDQPWSGVAVLAPGFVLGLFSLPPDGTSETPWELAVSQAGSGVLTLDLDDQPGQMADPVIVDGRWRLSLGLLTKWARSSGASLRDDRLDIPEMPSASYAFCGSLSGGIASCDTGFLPAGGALRLDATKERSE